MNTIKQIVTIIFTVLVFIFFSEALHTKFSLLNFIKGPPRPTISNHLLPSYNKAITASFDFDNQVRFYDEALLTGDSDLIMLAKGKSDHVRICIQDMIRINDLGEYPYVLHKKLKTLLQDYDNYTKEANSVYLSAVDSAPENQDAMIKLAKDQLMIKKRFYELTQYFLEELNNGIENVNNYFK